MQLTEDGAVVGANERQDTQTHDQKRTSKGYPGGPRSALGLYGAMRLGLSAYIIAELLWLVILAAYLVFPTYLPTYMFAHSDTDLNYVELAGLVYLLVSAVAFFFACRFIYRAMRNLHSIRSPVAEISPVWSVGYYFIPIANLFMPANAMSQIYHGTYQAVGEKSRHASPIPIWWAAWLLQGVPASIADNTEASGIPGFLFYLVSSALGIIAAVELIRMSDRISQRQELLKHGGVAQVFD